ncbi:hypothetical protein OSB04_023755 [Centaurea solstitialis]|uniref:Uncharacterized protein n=1 Tax=Centaurea solstitialis TaxID=347529 RepID=A0AA38SKH6_9ASTR|nr:hypothetical protein OSB04_023755 [Centaurea solstitialis]
MDKRLKPDKCLSEKSLFPHLPSEILVNVGEEKPTAPAPATLVGFHIQTIDSISFTWYQSKTHTPLYPALLDLHPHFVQNLRSKCQTTRPSWLTLPDNSKTKLVHFLAWKTQVQALLYGLDLFKFLDDSHPKLLPTISADESQVSHADYPQWFQQDRLIFGALVGNLSKTIVLMIQDVDSSRDAWEILEKTYASPSRGHIK